MTIQTSMNLAGRTVTITGAAGLIGSALSRGFAQAGASLVLVDLDEEGLQRIAKELDTPTLTLTCDVTDAGAVRDLVDAVIERFGAIDVLINNAGGNRRRLPHEVTLDDWTAVTDLNLKSVFLMCQTVGRHMISRRSGSIVNISSTCGNSGMGRGNFVFSVSKAGMNHMTRELALEWGASGVRVNGIAPSQVDSPTMREWMQETGDDGERMGAKFLHGVPLGRLVTADDIVGPALFLASDASAMVTGTLIPVDGGNLTANIAGTVGSPVELASADAR